MNTLEGKYTCVELGLVLGRRIAYCNRYYNTGYSQVAIVAVINYHNSKPRDWAVYIGTSMSQEGDMEKDIAFIARYGVKISYDDAQYYFPDISQYVSWRP